MTILCSAFASARAGRGAPSPPRSALASTGTGSNCDGGPSGFGESTALERSRPRNSSGRYSSATARPLHASSVVQMRAANTFFRTIRDLLKYSKERTTAHLGSGLRNSSRCCRQDYRVDVAKPRLLKGLADQAPIGRWNRRHPGTFCFLDLEKNVFRWRQKVIYRVSTALFARLWGLRPHNRPHHPAISRRPVVPLRRLRPREARATRNRIPWRWKRARSCPMPLAQIRPRPQCRATASPWKSARIARRSPNRSNVTAKPKQVTESSGFAPRAAGRENATWL